MDDYLGKPPPLPYVDVEDLERLAVDVGAGVFSAEHLYGWYASTVRVNEGREPVTKKRFGLALKQAGWAASKRYIDKVQVRCWLVTKPWLRRGEALLAREAAETKAKRGGSA